MTQPAILIVPGRGNSGAGHWQTHLQQRLRHTRRIEQDEWDTPNLEAWSQRIDATVRALATPPLIVAHSFGCLAAAHAQITYSSPVTSPGFLVASDNI